MSGNKCFDFYIILAIVYQLFWCQIHCAVVFAQLFATPEVLDVHGQVDIF